MVDSDPLGLLRAERVGEWDKGEAVGGFGHLEGRLEQLDREAVGPAGGLRVELQDERALHKVADLQRQLGRSWPTFGIVSGRKLLPSHGSNFAPCTSEARAAVMHMISRSRS